MGPYDQECGSAKSVVLFGLGGSGKTEIAVHFAQQQRHSYKAVFWVNGVDEIHMNAAYRDICRIVGKVGGDGVSLKWLTPAHPTIFNYHQLYITEWLLMLIPTSFMIIYKRFGIAYDCIGLFLIFLGIRAVY